MNVTIEYIYIYIPFVSGFSLLGLMFWGLIHVFASTGYILLIVKRYSIVWKEHDLFIYSPID